MARKTSRSRLEQVRGAEGGLAVLVTRTCRSGKRVRYVDAECSGLLRSGRCALLGAIAERVVWILGKCVAGLRRSVDITVSYLVHSREAGHCFLVGDYCKCQALPARVLTLGNLCSYKREGEIVVEKNEPQC